MKREYEEAFAEVDEILQLMPVDLLIKIPLQFKKIISENKAKDYKPNIKEPIEEEQLKYETKILLGLIYRDFLVTPEEREILQARDAEALEKAKQEMQEKYDIESIFVQKKEAKVSSNEDSLRELIVYKEQGFLKKIFNLIKGLFNKNKF